MKTFSVKVNKMTESHRVTYWVVLTNNKIKNKKNDIWDDVGSITPYYSESLEQANETALEWAAFLDVPAELFNQTE